MMVVGALVMVLASVLSLVAMEYILSCSESALRGLLLRLSTRWRNLHTSLGRFEETFIKKGPLCFTNNHLNLVTDSPKSSP